MGHDIDRCIMMIVDCFPLGHWFCSFPDCEKPCFIERNGRIHDYCSKTHADEHRKMKEGQGSWLFSWLPWMSASHQQHDATSKFSGGTSNQPTSPAIAGMYAIQLCEKLSTN